MRLRIFLVHLRTRVKNRIHGTLARYNEQVPGADLFGVAARRELGAQLPELPVHSREAVEQELAALDFLETQIESAEHRSQRFQTCPITGSIPVGFMLATAVLSITRSTRGFAHQISQGDILVRVISARRAPRGITQAIMESRF